MNPGILPFNTNDRGWSLRARRSFHWGLGLRVIAMVVLALAVGRTCEAINITMVFNAGANQAPGFDPAATGLIDLFSHAETFYEDVFEDAHNITINFWYEDLADPNIGVHSLVSQAGVPNRETEANIRIDTRLGLGGALRNWFIDPTPDNNSEFTMQQTLWRDLSAAQQADFYNNFGVSIPATFETGFTGAATAGGGASGLTDMLSVVMHEVGHALGMSAANNATIAQTADLDYDFNTAFVFGQTLASEVADGANIAHLDNGNALMNPSIGGSLRRLPSHTDLFSMASGHAYVSLDVPRREFYGGSDWNTDGNWSGDSIPGSLDEVFVRNPGAIVTANLSGSGFAASLNVSEGGNVDTEGFKLDVVGTATISDVDSDIFVRTGGELEATTIVVQNDAELNVEGGLVDANVVTLTQGTTSTFLQGNAGTVDVQTTLNNNATIRAISGGSLTFTSTGGGVWDLDGSLGNGIVQAVSGDLNFASGSVADDFDGDIDVGDATAIRTLTIAEPWTLGSGGVVDLVGGATVADRAQISGGTLTAADGVINSTGVTHINSPVILQSLLTTNVAASARLEFNGTVNAQGGVFNNTGNGTTTFDGVTTYPGGTLTFTGSLEQNGNASVTGATTINGDVFNFDGGGLSIWTFTNDLTLNVTEIDNVLEEFDGTWNINNFSSTVTVNTPNPWTHAGTLNIDSGTNLTFPAIAGQDFTLGGVTTITGGTRFDATVRLIGTITFTTNTSGLNLNGGDLPGTNRIEGAVVNGPAGSELRATTDSSLRGFGTINSDVDFSDDTELLADDGVLALNGSLNELGTIGTADADGTLNVANAWNTGLATELRMAGGVVTGAAITNDGTTRGRGQITSTIFINNNVTSADGGTLTLNSVTFPDLDGVSEAGVLNAVTGDLSVPGNFGGGFVFDGTINVGLGRQFSMPATSLVNFGAVNLTSGSLSLRGWSHFGTLLVNPGTSQITELGGGMDFAAASTTTLNGDLRLAGNAIIRSGAIFAGPRSLVVNAASTLAIENGATVGVQVVNLGRAEVGTSPGIAAVAAFTQFPSGTYEAEIDGQLVGTQYDQLQVIGAAALAGTLEVLINQNGGVYADPVGAGAFHAFTLLTYASVAGDFDTVLYAGNALTPEFGIGPGGDFVSLASCGLFRVVDYSAADLQLINYRALRGDANGDGFVDGSDFSIWNNNKFNVGTDWTSGDFNCDGTTDGSDFSIWNANKFTNIVLPRPNPDRLYFVEAEFPALMTSPIPEPHSWGVAVVLGMLLQWRRLRIRRG